MKTFYIGHGEGEGDKRKLPPALHGSIINTTPYYPCIFEISLLLIP